ncbi:MULTISPECIES: gluconate:H+ symporter [Clostridium]|uniref:High-affinity gluconate transporter n=3 Tax=Clostridium TaxID=1485 RepID=D8GNK7_CLOLD|nr:MULTISPECIES: gluconate:H+ symporter [Clostridium]ADK15870.1 high-affinity transport of gluconate - gluconate permease [Clostridium ljungdahlii DSM 13528]AGY75043.1 gluconate:H+ symporter [Clostridium autoethanogenum DSM 10061]ALU35217.1 Gluconate transporter [Clostridium autoethanogenum DSM 10061]OAA84259.1 High-affinity gluconate transporter [Clostridium ljungdahlii DSM 13528]OVY49282.1 High-affinity gluconate transporter [Clostridium autoethanogenum]
MSLVIVGIGVILLLVLMIPCKLNGFISLILVSLVVGVLEGMPLGNVTKSMYKGIGGQLNSLILILAFGAMLGKLMSDCGAGQRIATTLINKFGMKRVQWAMLVTSIIVGITMFFEAAFILLIPIIYSIVKETKLPLIYVGFPAVVALSVTHSFLPPHPGPTLVASAFKASVGGTLLLGLILAIPGAIIAGILFSKTSIVKNAKTHIPEGLTTSKLFTDEEMPSFGKSLFTAIVPVILIAISEFSGMFLPKGSSLLKYIKFFGDAPIALMITVIIAMFTFGFGCNRSLDDITKSMSESVKAIAMIILIIGAGGAFKQVLVDSGVGNTIVSITKGLNFSPIVLAWFIAAILRTALGSATVAVTAAAGLVMPLAASSGVNTSLMVLAVTTGSIFASHVNDPGFWMYKEYFGLSVADAIKTRTSYTCILSVIGLIGVLILNIFVH